MSGTVDDFNNWKDGKNDTEYNAIRFADDKFKAGREWLLKRKPDLNLDNPKTLIELIAKYKHEDLNPAKIMWADKIGVYSELYDLGIEELHIPMLSPPEKLYYKPNDSELEQLIKIAVSTPSIIKCNHASGWNIISKPGERFNLDFLKSKIKKWLCLNYAYVSGYEWHYEPIVPGLLVQPLLSERPIDWQFYCLDGDIVAISLQIKYGKSLIENIAWVDEKGKMMDWYLGSKPVLDDVPMNYKAIIEKMKPFVLEIAKKFKFVRVDLFYLEESVKFCEATFVPCSGVLDYSIRN